MTEEKKTDYLELAKMIYAKDEIPHNLNQIIQIAIAEELRRLNENMELANSPNMLEPLNSIIEACDEPSPHIPKIKHIAERAILASDK